MSRERRITTSTHDSTPTADASENPYDAHEVAARRQIVDGAGQWGRDIVELDSERKAAMVSNLMVVLCGDRAPQPVLNTGTVYR